MVQALLFLVEWNSFPWHLSVSLLSQESWDWVMWGREFVIYLVQSNIEIWGARNLVTTLLFWECRRSCVLASQIIWLFLKWNIEMLTGQAPSLRNQRHGKPELLHCGLGMKLSLAHSCRNYFNSFSQSLHPTELFFHPSWINVVLNRIILVTLLDVSLLESVGSALSCDKTRIRWM